MSKKDPVTGLFPYPPVKVIIINCNIILVVAADIADRVTMEARQALCLSDGVSVAIKDVPLIVDLDDMNVWLKRERRERALAKLTVMDKEILGIRE